MVPSLSHVFGYICFVQDLSTRLDRLSFCSIKCVFVDYLHTQKGYRCFHHAFRKICYFCKCHALSIFFLISLSSSDRLPASLSYAFSYAQYKDGKNTSITTAAVYSYCPKLSISVLRLFDPPSSVASSSHHSLPLDLDLHVTFQKGKRPFTIHPFLLIFYDKLTPFFCQLTLFPGLYPSCIGKLC